MNITETRNEGLEREYSIVVTAAEIDAKIEAKFAELAQTAKCRASALVKCQHLL